MHMMSDLVYNAEMDMRTLIDAAKIRADPKRLKAAGAQISKTKKDLAAVEATNKRGGKKAPKTRHPAAYVHGKGMSY